MGCHERLRRHQRATNAIMWLFTDVTVVLLVLYVFYLLLRP